MVTCNVAVHLMPQVKAHPAGTDPGFPLRGFHLLKCARGVLLAKNQC